MVSIKTLTASALAAALPASAYVNGISGPETAASGSNINPVVTTSIYVQNWVDYSIIWGLAPASYNCADYKCIGQQIGYSAAYPDQLPLGNFSVAIALPEVSAGDYQLFAAVPYLVGASGTVDVETFYFNITITDA